MNVLDFFPALTPSDRFVGGSGGAPNDSPVLQDVKLFA